MIPGMDGDIDVQHGEELLRILPQGKKPSDGESATGGADVFPGEPLIRVSIKDTAAYGLEPVVDRIDHGFIQV
ncbi:hypothetical protein GCM10027580_12980 [Corynebacterium faecale]